MQLTKLDISDAHKLRKFRFKGEVAEVKTFEAKDGEATEDKPKEDEAKDADAESSANKAKKKRKRRGIKRIKGRKPQLGRSKPPPYFFVWRVGPPQFGTGWQDFILVGYPRER